jgi:hypothetical protein
MVQSGWQAGSGPASQMRRRRNGRYSRIFVAVPRETTLRRADRVPVQPMPENWNQESLSTWQLPSADATQGG